MRILTPAKINLTLEIVGQRSDGYHDLATWMLPVGLYDTLEIHLENEQSFDSNLPELKADSSNLVIIAAELFNRSAAIDAHYSVRLEKKIPLGAGLGGGSSDAAATLLLLNELHRYPLSSPDLRALAAEIGSDVPFFIHTESSWCTSRGEVMEPRDFPRGLWILLAKPGFGVSTAGAYHAFEALPSYRRRGRETSTPWGRVRNDLEPAVFPKYLLLPVMRDWLAKQPDTMLSLMSGSGSTIFAVVRSQSEGVFLRTAFQRVFGQRIWTSVCQLNPEHLAG
jgi:4-diphosphocytidyl-2-C-methyl-D-erythritol kinase